MYIHPVTRGVNTRALIALKIAAAMTVQAFRLKLERMSPSPHFPARIDVMKKLNSAEADALLNNDPHDSLYYPRLVFYSFSFRVDSV